MLAGDGTFCGRGDSGVKLWWRMCSASCGGLDVIYAKPKAQSRYTDRASMEDINSMHLQNAPSRQGRASCWWPLEILQRTKLIAGLGVLDADKVSVRAQRVLDTGTTAMGGECALIKSGQDGYEGQASVVQQMLRHADRCGR